MVQRDAADVSRIRRPGDLPALLRDRVGPGSVHGIVPSVGEDVLPFGDRLTSMPASALRTILRKA
jgi:hypothetical protein